MTAIPALAGLRSLRRTQGWQLLAYIAALAVFLTGFTLSGYVQDPEQISDATSDIEIEPRSWLVGGANLLPGAYATEGLVIRNRSAGAVRLSLRAAASTSAGRDLAEALYLILRTAGSGCDRFDGSVLARGPVLTFWLGDQAPGDQPGDRMLAPATAEALCLRVLVPLDTGNEFQGTSTVLRLIVSAEGVADR